MKNLSILSLALALLLAACQPAAGPDPVPVPGAPVAASIAGARGVFLQASGASRSTTFGARAIVAADAGALGEVTAAGAAEAVTFTDADGLEVEISITRACELDAGYVLVAYTYGAEATAATGLLNLDSGVLSEVAHAPANWGRIFSRDARAWYVSAGGLYQLELATGTASLLSAQARGYQSAHTYMTDATDTGASSPWAASTWVYADASGNVYALDASSGSAIKAQVVTTTGARKDFGFQYEVETFSSVIPGYSVSAKVAHALYDATTGRCYIVHGQEIWDNNPEAEGGAVATGGYVLHLYPVTFSPGATDVLDFTMISPIAYSVMDGATAWTTTYVGAGFLMDASVLSFGDRTYKTTASSIAAYNTAAVPVSHITPMGDANDSFVANWQFSGGEVYAGPTDASSAISLVSFSSPTAAVKTLVSEAGIQSWSVVGGVLFYTTASGTYKAAIDTATGTLGPVEEYSGGPVTAVTQ